MRTKKCLVTWFLVVALLVMQLPLQAATYREVPIRNQDGYDFSQITYHLTSGWSGLAIGEYCHVKVGQRIAPSFGQWGHFNMEYYTTPNGIIIDEKMESLPNVSGKARTMLPKKPTELHMAYYTDMEWCIERSEITTASIYIPVMGANQDAKIHHHKVYPKVNYYGVNYNLDAGSWKESTDWTEEGNGIWKATEEQYDDEGKIYAGNIWFAYDGFKVVLPKAEEVSREGYELLGWQVGNSTLNPGVAYTLAEQDAQVDANGQYTIPVKAVWARKNVEKPVISSITLNTASVSAIYKAGTGVLTGCSFEYKKAADSTWTPLTTKHDTDRLTADLRGLKENTEYQIKAYIETSTGKIESEIASFKTIAATTNGSGSSSSSSGSGGGGSAPTTPAVTPTVTPAKTEPAAAVSPQAVKKAEEAIQKLPEAEKQEIVKEIKEDLPYTLPAGGLTVEQLKALTKNKLTEAELQTIVKKPELLKALGIDTSTLAATVVLKPIENPEFKDVATSHWAADTIKEAARLGIAAGTPDGKFEPSEPLQAADTFTFLNRVLLRNNITASTLPRSTVEKYMTDKEHWAFRNMASIGSKLSEDTLKTVSEQGDKPLTRELLAQSLYEITKGKLKVVKEVPAFTDTQSSPYQEAINYCVAAGLLSGTSDNTMSPQKELTRAELMTILIRLDKMLK